MSACVESMFSVREVPWHGLGTIVQDAPDSKEAIRLAGLDWRVKQSPVFAEGKKIDGYWANVRDIDNAVLGIVTTRYKIVQNDEAFAFTDALLGEGVTYETAGSLLGGKKVWLLARMERMTLAGEDYDPYLVFFNSHDGSGAIKVAITPIRVVCMNTLNLALSQASRIISCVHKGNIEGKLDEARFTLFHAKDYFGKLDKELDKLKLKKIADEKVKEFVEELLPLSDGETSKVRIKNIESMRKDLLYRYFFAPDLIDTEKSAYRFINAVSDFATHTDIHKNTKSFNENRFANTVNGNPLIDKAYLMVKEVA